MTVRAAATALLLAAGCGAPAWRVAPGSPPLGLLGDPEDVVGAGIAAREGGAVARPCLEAAAGPARGARPGVEVRRLRGEDPPGVRSVEALAVRVGEAAEGEAEARAVPAAEVLVVSARGAGQRTALDEAGLRLRVEAREALARGPADFLRLCGTEVVVSTTHEAAAHLAVGYAPTTVPEAVTLERTLHGALGGDPDDVRRLRAVAALPPDAPSAAAYHAETRDAVEPLVARGGGAALAGQVAASLGAVASAARGRTLAVETRPWSEVTPDLLAGLAPGPLGDAGEVVHRTLGLLEAAARSATRRLRQAEAVGGAEGRACAALAGALAPAWAPERRAACAGAARGQGAVTFQGVCAELVAAIARVDEAGPCRAVRARAAGLRDPLLRDDTWRPLRLLPPGREAWYPEPDAVAAAVRGGATRAAGPSPGDGSDARGRGGYARCADVRPDAGGPAGLRRVQAVTATGGPRPPAWWERLLFWRDARPRARHHGVVEVLAARPPLLPSFPVTGEAERLARTDLRAFFERCGTHYVSQVLARRGVAFDYAAGDGGEALRIRVAPRGLARRDAGAALLHPATASAFLSGQVALVEFLRDADGGIPEAILLEPWVEVLRERGIVE